VHCLNVPRINDGQRDFEFLFNIWNGCHDLKELELDFSRCDFLRPNAVAFLGGMVSFIKMNGGTVILNVDSFCPALEANLEQNGFLDKMGLDAQPWDGNSIPYRVDQQPEYQDISLYLKDKWVGKGWLNIDPELVGAIVSNVLEIYMNAFSHGYSPNGVHSCGQRYPSLDEITITVVDFGIGIPQSVRNYLHDIGKPDEITDEKTLKLAFQDGFSTKPELGGMGLKLLKDFIQENEGRLDIYSHSGHAIIDNSGEKYGSINSFFRGTVVNISINIDQKFYHLPKT